jgi:hypothetical protein
LKVPVDSASQSTRDGQFRNIAGRVPEGAEALGAAAAAKRKEE